VFRRPPVAAAAVFWLFITAVYDLQIWWLSHLPGERIDLRMVYAWQTPYFLLWFPITLAIWRITAQWIPETPGAWAAVAARHVPLFVATAAVHLVATVVCVAALGQLRGPFVTAVLDQMRGRLHLELLVYTAIAGTGAALALHERFRDRQIAAAKLEAELSAARLDALRRQLQPHFLFNSLHSIASLARAGDTAGVVRLIAGFSDLLRHLLEQGDRHLPLDEELQLVERYLEIQRVRFADRLQATIDMDPAVARACVPLLVVQPLVENALRHGLGPRVEAGLLVVRARREGDWTRIDVEDTGVGLPPGWTKDTAAGTGLRNLASRLAAEFGTAWSLDVTPRSGGGAMATVRIPFAAATGSNVSERKRA
jgi:signal transduction histidine kinase